MAMSVGEARFIADAEKDNIERFLSYLGDVGVQQLIMDYLLNDPGISVKRAEAEFSIFRSTLADVNRSNGQDWWEGAPSLYSLQSLITVMAEEIGIDEVSKILPHAVVPDDRTIEAYLVLFHESKGYVEGPQDSAREE